MFREHNYMLNAKNTSLFFAALCSESKFRNKRKKKKHEETDFLGFLPSALLSGCADGKKPLTMIYIVTIFMVTMQVGT